MIIDVHTHIVPEHFPPVGDRSAGDQWPYMDHTESGKANVMIGGRNFRTVLSKCWDVSRRVSDMPEEGVDRHVISPMPELLAYQLPAEDGRDLSMHLNETIVSMVEDDPEHFYGLGTVPLQDPEMATKELRRVKELGLLGIETMTNINGKSLGDPVFRPFLKEAEALDLSIFIHAQRPTFMDRVYGPAVVTNSIGFPIENGLSAASLITGGVLEECPALRICLSHGGGVLSNMLHRMDALWGRRTGTMPEGFSKSPIEYAQMLYYDDILFSIDALELLVKTVGISQITVGSDYPFMTRKNMPLLQDEFKALGLSKADIEAMSSGNALRFLGLG
ncbi:MAG: amidohydrolase family protein [Dehalococcoidia bacterium]